METFDLSAPSAEVARKYRAVRTLWTFVAVSAAALAAWLFELGLSGVRDSFQALVLIVVESGALFVVGLCVFSLWKSRPGAIALSIDSGGIWLKWSTNSREFLTWNKIEHECVLLDYSAHPTLPRHTQYLWEIRRWKRPATRLTREAFEGIVRAAKVRGLEVLSTYPSNPPWRWARCRAVRIMLPAHPRDVPTSAA
jgi:hypothetical protein